MNNKSRLLTLFLVLTIVVLGFLLYRSEKKARDYAEHIETVSRTFIFGSTGIQMHIDDLEQLKTDTSRDESEMTYSFIRNNFQRENAFRMFVLATSVNDVGSNQHELDSLVQEYSLALDPIQSFYAVNDSLIDVQPGEIDSLIRDYKKLKQVTEQFEKMRIDW